MKAKLLFPVIVLISLSGCSKPDPEVEDAIASLNRLTEQVKEIRLRLHDETILSDEIDNFYRENGGKLSGHVKESVKYCEGKKTGPCIEFHESMQKLKQSVGEQVSETMQFIEQYKS